MVYRSSAHEHDQEALQELTTGLDQINVARKTAGYQLANFASQRQQLVESMDVASEIMESMNRLSKIMDQFNDLYFGPDGAFTQAIESANMASEFAQEINNMGLPDDLELASTRLAATSNLATSRLVATRVATRSLSYQLSQSPAFNLGATTKYLFENSDFHEAVQATEEISGMFDDLAWMGAQTATYQEPTTPEPGYREAPFHEDARETRDLLAAYLWAAVSDSGEFASELSAEEKMLVRHVLTMFVGLAVGTVVAEVMSPRAGIPAGFGASALATKWLSDWYDMKRRQRLPEDE